ncbi:MAG: hypothetical protein ACI8S3_001451, partial [Alphaproteobacteria bacterium]
MSTDAINQIPTNPPIKINPALAKALAVLAKVYGFLANILWGTPLRAKITAKVAAGVLILFIWQAGVSLFAAKFVAK